LSGFVGGIVAVVALVLAGWSAERSFALPTPEELAPNTVARVFDAPAGAGTITVAEFRHALDLVSVAAGRRSVPQVGANDYERLRKAAIGSLLESAWLFGQAAEWGIAVTPREVSRELALIKRQSFESRAEYRKFLREMHYTRRDVNERVELQLLSVGLQQRIQARIEREARNEFEEQRGLREFVAEFNERWRARTVCAPLYVTERCSNGPPLAD
jgi:SurA N-terminal domain